MSERGATLFEVLFFGFNLFCGIVLGILLAKRYGTIGWVGVPVGFGLGILLLKTLGSLAERKPLRPGCVNGRCAAADYRYLEMTRAGAVFECSCGTRHVKKGRKFSVLLTDGSVHPYMEYRPFVGWRETSKQTNPPSSECRSGF